MNVRSFGKICSVDSPSQWNIFCFRLAEVGKLEPVKLQGNYDTGQMFLHRVFGYRGVILFPWTARVYDRDMPNKRDPRYERGIVDMKVFFWGFKEDVIYLFQNKFFV